MTKIHISIETEDMDLAERIGRTLNGNMTERVEAVDVPPPAADLDAAKPDVYGSVQDFTQGANAATTAEAPEPAQPAATTAEPAATADTPAPAPSATETGSVETDAAGLPWDYRIHASTKTKTADGKWKKKRSVADADRAKVEAELHQAMSIPAPTDAPADAAPAPAPAPEPEPETAPPPPPAAEQGTPAPTDFMGLVGEIGRIGANQEDINQACAACNPPVPSFQALASRPDLIPAFWEQLNKG